MLLAPLFAVAVWSPLAAPAAAAPETGQQVYTFYCYQCHGYAGDASTLAATYLNPPPRNFVASDPAQLSREAMIDAVGKGRPGTAMVSFASVLDPERIEAVVDYVRDEFMSGRAPDYRYHTAENGWPDHQRYGAAFPFVRGELPLSSPPADAAALAGWRLFMSACISCHDRGGRRGEGGLVWDARAVSYPRGRHDHRAEPPAAVDAFTGASPYLAHEVAPVLGEVSAEVRRGEAVFQANCAFCHGASGTGRNWIGSFMEPHPRDLTDPEVMAAMTRQRAAAALRNGVPGTSMPAWGGVLTEAEQRAVLDYIDRAFHPLASGDAEAATGSPPPPAWNRVPAAPAGG